MRRVYLTVFLLVTFLSSYSQCSTPSTLYVSATTATTATLGFVSSGSSPWQIEYGPIGFSLGNGTLVNVTSKTPTITGLPGSTTLEFYVRDTCANGTVSSWAGPKSFSTSCSGSALAPSKFTFDTNNWIKATTWNTPGNLSSCWVSSPTNAGLEWSTGPPFFVNNSTGPSNDHSPGNGGQYVYLARFGFSSDLVSSLRMPRTSLVGLNNPELSFWYHMFGNQIDKLVVEARKYNGGWTTLTTIVGQKQNSKNAAWKEEILSLNQFKNDTVFIRFRGYRTLANGINIQISLDDIKIAEGSSCPKPSNFTVVSTTNNSATLNWTTGSASNWQVEYGPAGFTPGNGTLLNVSAKPYIVTGLSPQTTYSFYVRDSCNATDKSAWAGPINGATACSAVLAPYTENFDGSTWVRPAGFGQLGSINTCWRRQHTSNLYWETGAPAFVNNFTGPSSDHTTGSGKYIFTERAGFSTGTKTSITSPLIDLSNLTVPELTFWYHMFGSAISKLEVLVDSGNGFNLVKTYTGTQQTSGTDAWKECIVSLSAYANTSIKVKFRGTTTTTFSNQCRMAVDDFKVRETPSCPKPSNLQLVSTASTSVNYSWTTGGATNWIVKYKPVSGTLSYQAVSSNPNTTSGLTAATTYHLWVKDSCGLANVSDWIGPLIFTTDCVPLSAPYSENFDANGFVKPTSFSDPGKINSCWSREHTSGFFWTTGKPFFTNNFTGPSADHTTGNGQYLVSDAVGFANSSNTYIISPAIDMSSLTSPELTFWYHMFGTGVSSLKVEINNGSGWSSIFTKSGAQQTSGTAAWLEAVINLSTYASDTVKFKFTSTRITFSTLSEIAIDDISVHELPSCAAPTNLQLVNTTNSSANISWTSGGASNYIVKHKPASGSYTYNATTNNNPHNISGLSPNTKYEVWVRDSCGSNDVSFWKGPLFFSTDCNPFSTPFTENFDGSGWVSSTVSGDNGDINSCWKRSDTSVYSWIPRTGVSFFFGTGPSGDHTGNGNYMMTHRVGFTGSNLKTELTSPLIDIGNMQAPELKFWYHQFGTQIDRLKVFVIESNGTKTLLTSIIGQTHTSKSAAWLEKVISLNAYKNDTIKLIFEGARTTSFGFSVNIAIDDVSITDAVCVNPSNLAVTNIKGTSADVSWTTTNTNSNLEYDLAGYTQGQGNYVPNVTSTHTLTGLAPFTTYDVYIKDSCATNNTSTWIGPVTFDTDCDTLIADFSSNASNLNVTFDGVLSSGTFINYTWSYGDGNNGVGVNPSHTYAIANTYLVTLVVTDTCGKTDTISKNITVCDKPVAIISYSVNGYTVNFDGTASLGAVSYLWDLDNGGFNTLPAPSFTYPGNGTYSISLVITNLCGDTDTAYVVVDICDKPTSYFEFKIKGSNGFGMTVDFNGSLSQGYTSFLWLFGDGTTDNSSLTPTHLYAVPGLFYKVSLVTYSSCGVSDTMTLLMADVISIDEWGTSLISAFPNPATENVRITLPTGADAVHFKWYDLAGKLLHVPVIDSGRLTYDFDVSALKPATYFLVLSDESGSVTLKISVE